MSKLEWNIHENPGWKYASVWTAFGLYEVTGYNDESQEPTEFFWRLNMEENGNYTAGEDCDSLESGLAACQEDYDASVADIAAANGYVKIEPGQVVVDSVHLRWLVDANCRDSCQAYESLQECSQCWVELLRQEASAAIEAAKGE